MFTEYDCLYEYCSQKTYIILKSIFFVLKRIIPFKNSTFNLYTITIPLLILLYMCKTTRHKNYAGKIHTMCARKKNKTKWINVAMISLCQSASVTAPSVPV